MGTVFKRKVNRNGKLVELERYYIEYRGLDGRRKREAAYADRQASVQKLAQREREVARCEVGLADPYAEHRKTPIAQHLADYETHLRAKGAGGKHIRDVVARLQRTFAFLKVRTVGRLRGDAVERFLLHLIGEDGLSKSTRNQYLTDLRAFLRWGVRAERWPQDTLQHVRPLRGQDDVRRRRRAFTEAELKSLFEAAERRPVAELLKRAPKASEATIRKIRHAGRGRAVSYRLMAYSG